ncbi:50S ribosome-binding protein YggL [Shewanella dokdonensis]|uniref:DUF469 family protein n=1 Tax=Shewanella dokdonensis TaxID=712036 RepID=A0ABX8DGX9_9GAMM|nr:50S ribosome-binding protein YggL [Shewanella dokdonensis]MCL1074150.1 50S ribosome-binding protein YggL [Shewanella dokdonensis]QVK23881.1 DUF469 family protein [Shewanella dokdonensis]
MAIRSRRLRKKLRVDEFQELGFDVSWRFADSLSEEDIDEHIERFINEVIEPRELGFHGGGHRLWDGVIATQRLGKCTEEDRQTVARFLKSLNAEEIEISELYDIWWG